MDDLLKKIKEIEGTEIKYDIESTDYFNFKEGEIPILISAPHGARHLRKNNWKEEDEYTASIAIMLAEMANAHVIYVKNATREDPNYSKENRYKDKINEVVNKYGIKFILDLHGAKKNTPFKIGIGIIDEKTEKCSCITFKETIQRAFSGFQENKFNPPGYTASYPGTITYFAKNKLGIEAAQFEINAKFRIVERKPDSTKAKNGEDPNYKANEKDVLELIEVMERLIADINDKITMERL